MDEHFRLGAEPALHILADEIAAHEEEHEAGRQAHDEERQHQPRPEPGAQEAAAALEVELRHAADDDEQEEADGQHIGQAQRHEGPARRRVDARRVHPQARGLVCLDDHDDEHDQPGPDVEAGQLGVSLLLGHRPSA